MRLGPPAADIVVFTFLAAEKGKRPAIKCHHLISEKAVPPGVEQEL